MLYILPPRRSPNPPSPFTTILNWSNNGNSASNSSNSSTTTTTTTSIENKSTTWSATVASGNNNSNNRRPPRVRLRNLQIHNKTNQDVTTGSQDDMDTNRNPKSLSECYFAGKGAALVLPAAEAQNSNRRSAASAVVAAAADDGYNNSGGGGVVIDDQGGDGSNSSSNIQKHLQSMFYLLRPEETLKMAVKLESVHPSRTRYLVVVSRMGNRDEESCLLGIDCNEQTTVGLVLKVMADTTIRLDGDGGFSVSVCSRHHIFKPVSVQAMWSALQTLHKVSSKAREKNYFQSGLTHDWVNYYEERIKSERSCLNEWHAMDNLESKRPPSPDSVQLRTKSSTERQQTEFNIRIKLKEIMMSVDLDEVTSKYIRNRLEDDLNMDLGEYKSYIDEEMLMILGQMDAPTEIFDHVYLGSEWNASNYEELQRNGVGHILNVTREIDNFFPGTFDYLNVRVYDDEKTDLLKHWDDTFKYITKAKKSGSKVLVHCKMGVSRSASVVIAYAMKAYNWDFKTAMEHVKIKRTCIKPNTSFLTQLETYQGILDAMKNKEKLQRSKSENNLKSTSSSATTATNNNNINNNNNTSTGGRSNKILLIGSAPTPLIQAELFNKYCCRHRRHQRTTFKTTTECHLDSDNGDNNMMTTIRPKSWSPDHQNSDRELIDIINKSSPIFLSLEDLTQQKLSINRQQFGRNVLMPCDNGESYSVSPNQIVHLPGNNNNMSITVDCDKEIIKSSSNSNYCCISDDDNLLNNKVTMLRAVLVKKEIWDPGENNKQQQQQCPMSKGENENDQNILVTINNNNSGDICDLRTNNNSNNGLIINNNDTEIPTPTTTVWTSSTILKNVFKDCGEQQQLEEFPETTVTRTKVDDLFSNQLDRVFDREEKKQQSTTTITTQIDDNPRECPSRQNSWSSYDSACVLNYQNECRADTNNVVLSRHSSWGSGDTRCLPSRNSSWGSYDMRPRGPCYYVNENGEKVLNQSSSSSKLTTTSGSIPWTSSVDDVVVVVNNNKKSSRSSSSSSESSSSSSSSEILFRQRTDDDLYDDDPNDELVNNKSVNISSSNAITIAVDQDDDNISTTSVGGDAVVSDDDDDDDSIISRLSASAPETSTMDLISKQQQQLLSKSSSNIGDNNDDNNVISTAQCSSVKQHRLLFLENLYNNCRQKPCSNRKRSNEKIISSRGGSIVKSLKKEFEAKTIIHDGNLSNDCVNSSLLPIVVAPAPSPPPLLVSFDQNNLSTIRVVDDDLKFKNLVDIFETNQEQQQINNDLLVMRTLKNHNKQSNSNNNVRCVSCIEVGSSSSPSMEMIKNPLINVATASASSNNKKIMCGDFNKRPPIFPVVRCSNFVGGTTANSTSVAAATATSPHLMVAATVIAKAAKKQQQQFGKSHPLARLNIKPRHNNPVYNTM